MRQWLVLLRKEMLELWRSYKWLWVPLVFILLGAMQPAATHYMPQLIDTFGGLPEGAVIEIPTPEPGAVIGELLGQFGTIGLLVLALSAMGTVVAERNSGAAAMLWVKPVSFTAYLAAKWAAYCLLILVALLLGQLAAWYYTDILIGPFPIGDVLSSALVFALWLVFIVAVLIFASVFLRSAAAVAFVTLAVALLLSVLTSLFGAAMSWSPAALPSYATALLTGADRDPLILPLAVTVALTGVLMSAAIAVLRRA